MVCAVACVVGIAWGNGAVGGVDAKSSFLNSVPADWTARARVLRKSILIVCREGWLGCNNQWCY